MARPTYDRFSEARLQVRVPKAWIAEHDEAARANGQTRAGLVRLVLRAFLRGRLEEPV